MLNGTTFATGKAGNAFLFDGIDDALQIPDTWRPSQVTAEAWVKFNSLSSNTLGNAPNGLQYLLLKENAGGYEAYTLAKADSNRLAFAVASNAGQEIIAYSSSIATTGVWYDLVGTYDGSASKLYVNGQLEGTTAGAVTINYGSKPLVFGTSGIIGYDGKFNGVLDEVQIFNRALSITEVQSIYNAGSAGICTNVSRKTLFDFDGDGKADVSVFRPIKRRLVSAAIDRTDLPASQFGASTDKIVPADYDGDGKTDVAVYRDGTWYLQRSQSGFTGIAFGAADDIPVRPIMTATAKLIFAVFRPSNGTWYSATSQSIGFIGVQFGQQRATNRSAADYDGDGKADIAVFRPRTAPGIFQTTASTRIYRRRNLATATINPFRRIMTATAKPMSPYFARQTELGIYSSQPSDLPASRSARGQICRRRPITTATVKQMSLYSETERGI